MTHREKVTYLLSELRAKGFNEYTVAPPVFRLLWALGFTIPPPLFLHFVPVALLMGFLFGAGWGLFMWLIGTFHAHIVFPSAIAAGALFGLAMAAYYHWIARTLKLPEWKHYGISN